MPFLGSGLLGGGLGVSGVAYLLRDEFTTDRAAGSVDGTAAEPGPGVRGIVDVGSKISISNGYLYLNGGTDTLGETVAYATPTITRAAGRVVIQDFNIPTAGPSATYLGAVTDPQTTTPGWNNVAVLFDSTSIVARRESGGTSPFLYTISADTDYTLVTVLRNTGKYLFLVASGIVRLIWFDAWDTTATLYLAAQSRINSASIRVNGWRVPSLFYAVDCDASDSFNRSDGDLGSTDGAGHAEAGSGDGISWSAAVGTWSIVSNKAQSSALSSGIAIAVVDTSNTNNFISADLTRTGGNVGLVLRYVDSNNYIYAYHTGTQATVRKVVAGVDSQVVALTSSTYSAGAKLKFAVDGTSVYVWYNDLYIGTGVVADAALQTGTKCGLFTTDTTNTFDNFVALPRRGYTNLTQY